MVANGTSSRKWANGPSVPLTTPFRDDESIDHEALAKQVVRLAKAGEGIVLLGTNGEGESDNHEALMKLEIIADISFSPIPA
jgi:dihydrodipicolinate synthase/N-acetylneuraminate lyase